VPSFDQLQGEFLKAWADRVGASQDTRDAYKGIFNRFKGLLKYRGFSGDFAAVDSSILDHFAEILDDKGYPKAKVEEIKSVLVEFLEFAKSKTAPEKPEAAKPAKKKEKKEPVQSRENSKPIGKLSLIALLILLWIASVILFLYFNPGLSPSLVKPLQLILAFSVLLLIFTIFRIISALV